MSMTMILLAVSVGCNLWFLFLLLYDRIMDTKIARFFIYATFLFYDCHI